jgi:hypothetical protein
MKYARRKEKGSYTNETKTRREEEEEKKKRRRRRRRRRRREISRKNLEKGIRSGKNLRRRT